MSALRGAFRPGLVGLLALLWLLALPGPASADIEDFCGEGSAAGQCRAPDAVAADEAAEELFVADTGNFRVSVFDAQGTFLRAFGWDVIPAGNPGDTGTGLETCTEATGCQAGKEGSGPGQLQGNGPDAIAVDPLGNAVYLSEAYKGSEPALDNFRVQKFSPEGELIWILGAGVNKGGGVPSSPGDLCTAEHLENGDACGAGSQSKAATGIWGAPAPLGIGPAGVLYLGDNTGGSPPKNRVRRFLPDGSFVAECELPELNETELRALAVDPLSGDFYAVSRAVKGVRRYDSTCVHKSSIDQFARALATNGEGDLLVADRTSPPSIGGSGLGGVYRYDSSGAPVRTFYGNGTLQGNIESLAPLSSATGDIFALEATNPRRLSQIAVPPPGPVVLPNAARVDQNPGANEVADTRADPVGSIRATFKTRVNPEGDETEVHFEYVDEAAYQQDKGEGGDGFAEARSVPEEEADYPSVPADIGIWRAHEAVVGLDCADPETELLEEKCLEASTVYHLRAVARNAAGTDIGPEATFKTRPAIELGPIWATNVGADSARLHARLDPIGSPTSVVFQYIEQSAYERNVEEAKDPFAGAAESGTVDFGQAEAATAGDALVGPLNEGTTYRYRYVASNFFDEYEGPTAIFTTTSMALAPKSDCPNQALRTGAAASLPDCRAYELVSPLEKGNSDVVPPGPGGHRGVPAEQAASSGEALAYTAFHAFGESVSAPFISQYLARRDPASGWSSHSLNPLLEGGNLYEGTFQLPVYKGFSEDLCSGWLVQNTEAPLAGDPPRGVPNLYRRRECGGEPYELLTTAAPPGFGREGEEGTNEAEGDTGSKYYSGTGGWSEDGTLTAFKAAAVLTPEASIVGQGKVLSCQTGEFFGVPPELTYQWLRDGVAIATPDQEDPQYQTSAADAGKALQCRVLAVNKDADENSGGKAGAIALSNPAQVVAPAPATMPPIAPHFIPAPDAGAPLEVGGPGGQQLSCDAREAGWQGSPEEFSYRWYRNGEAPALGRGFAVAGSSEVTGVFVAQGTGNLTAGSNLITGLSTTDGVFVPGQTITGNGIPASTEIIEVGTGTLELSQAATVTAKRTLKGGPQPFAVGWEISGEGIPEGTTIDAIAGQALTLSTAATATSKISGTVLAGTPITQTYTLGPESLAGAATFQCVVAATNAGGTVAIASARLNTTGPGPEPPSPKPRAFVLDVYRVYAKQGEKLGLVSVLPGGEAVHTHAAVGTRPRNKPSDGNGTDSVIGAVSDDGERIFFSATMTEPPQPVHVSVAPLVPRGQEGSSRLYVRTNPLEPQSALAAPAGSGNGTLEEGSTVVAGFEATSGEFEVGQQVAGSGIPFGTTVSDLGAGTLTLSAPSAAKGKVRLEAFGKCTEPAKACTVAISGDTARFIAADPGATKALYLEGPDYEQLYALDMEAALDYEPTSATRVAGRVLGVFGASEDVSRAYLVSEDVCNGGAPNSEDNVPIEGEPNLYLYEAGESCAADDLAFVGTLGAADLHEEEAETVEEGSIAATDVEPFQRRSRVSGDGLHAAFMSRSSLTGYDNTDAVGDKAAAEVFLYDAEAAELRCVSCNPGGGRPRGVDEGSGSDSVWVAAQIPGWLNQWHPGHALSEDGSQLFFESHEGLVARDNNGRQDVYQWREAASKEDCEAVGAERYVPDSEGCLSLISSGKSVADSEFLDASASGSDVFFRTASSLVDADYGLVDIYDARVGGGFPGDGGVEEPECEGEACQSPPPPPSRQTPSSAAFAGEGDVPTQRRVCPKGKRKVRRGGKTRCVRKQQRKAKRNGKSQRNGKGRRSHNGGGSRR